MSAIELVVFGICYVAGSGVVIVCVLYIETLIGEICNGSNVLKGSKL